MTTSLEVIRKVTIQGSAQGVDQATASVNRLADAQNNLAVVSDSSAKRALSAEASYRKQTLSIDDQARAQANIAKATKVADAALAQGIITQDEHVKRVSLINQKYGEMSGQQKALSAVTQDLNGRIGAATGSLGTFGQVLTAFGPAGIAFAATLGAAVLAFYAMSDAAHALADKAQALRAFSDTTGLTTIAVQALGKEAAKFGVTSEEAQSAIQHFTTNFEQLRLGQGNLLTQIRRVNPALADQMQMTTDAGQALTLFGRALTQVDDIFQRNALVKAAAGRGGLSTAAFFTGLDVGKVTQDFQALGRGIDDNMITKLKQLKIEIDETSKAATNGFSKMFAGPVLEAELAFWQNMKSLSDLLKGFTISSDFQKVIDFVSKYGTLNVIPVVGPLLSLGRIAMTRQGGPQGDSFSSRFQPAVDSPLKAFTPAASPSEKTPEAQVADMKALIGVLGPAATVTEQLTLKQKELALAAKNAGVSTETLARAQAALNNEFKLTQLREQVSTLGAAATQAEQYSLKVAELDQKLHTGAISQETYNRALADFKSEQALTILKNNVAALGSAATASEQYSLKVAELQQQLDRGVISQNTFNRAVRAADPMFQFAKASFESFSQSLAQGLLSNKSLVDSLHDSFNNLATMAANAGIKNLLEGNFAMAAVDAVVTIGAKIASGFTDDSQAKELKKAQEAWAGMNQQLKEFQATADGFDMSGPASQINNLRATFDALNVAAFKAQDYAGMQKALQAFGGNLGQVVKSFEDAQSPMSDFAKQITTLTTQANQLAQTLFANGSALGDEVLAKLPAQIDALKQKASAGLQADINAAQGKGFINDFTALLDKISQLHRDQAITGISDALINTDFTAEAQKIVDDSSLVGSSFDDLIKRFPQLAGVVHQATSAVSDSVASLTADINAAQGKGFINDITSLFARVQSLRTQQSISGIPTSLINDYFVAQAQKIIDDSNLVGAAFNNLLTTFPDLTGKVHESTAALQKQADAQSQLAQQLNQAAKSVVDYVNSLNVGPDSALSPQARLNAAQSTYNATLTLAQSGNIDALNRVTADFENLRKAAQSFFGSSGGYQSILNSGIAQLLALPAVQSSTDPVVQALLNVQQAVQATTAAAQGTTGAVTAGTGATVPRLDQVVSQLVTAVNNLASVIGRLDAGNSTAAASNNVLVALNSLQASGNSTLSAIQNVANSSNSTLSAIQGLQNTASQQLTLLNANLTTNGITATGVGGSGNFTENNKLLDALNKIVVSTYATAYNTARLNDGFKNGSQFFQRVEGAFAGGGILGAGAFGIMGEHHPDGPFIVRAGSSPVPITPALPSFANDNSELRAIRAELAALRKEMELNTAVTHEGNRINGEGHAANVKAVDKQTRAASDQAISNRLQNRAAS